MGNRKTLGLAISESGCDIVELHAGKRKHEIRRWARFDFPSDERRENAREVGRLLSHFLRENHFSARRTAVAVPAGWLLAREKNLPPASPDAAAGILRMEAERDFTIDIDDLALDYAGAPAKDRPSKVFLVGILKKRLARILEILDSAGLKCVAVSPASTLVADIGLNGKVGEGASLALILGAEGAELLARSDDDIKMLRQVSSPVEKGANGENARVSQNAAAEIRRLYSLVLSGNESSSSLLVWDGAGLGKEAASELAGMLNMPLKGVESLASLGVTLHHDCRQDIEPISAAAAALAAGRAGRSGVDFLNPLLAVKAPASNMKKLTYAAAAALVVIALGGWAAADTIGARRTVKGLEAQLSAIRETVDEAEYFVVTVNHASNWYAGEPRHMFFLRDLTLLFPEDGRVWVRRLNINSNMHVVIAGRGRDEQSILALLDRINSSDRFSNLKTQYLRETGTTARDYSFEISFDYIETRVGN